MSRSPGSPTERPPSDYLAGWQATLRLLRQGKSWSGHERDCAFLNVSTSDEPTFANVSAVTGLDFPDDGRGLAIVDWDGDGDLDLWLANRTGPRLRLMLNHGASGNAWVAFRLRGTTSNRDAIGARVEVVSKPGAGSLVRTLYAGDGFLSQSSKWLHFGLGRDPEIERLTVRWPGGETETFAGAEPGRRYLLVEGSGAASPVEGTRTVALEPSVQDTPAPSPTARAFLPVRVPMPRLRHARFESPAEESFEVASGPLLINFWATWCLPCIAELKDLTAREKELRAAGLGVLALSVDGLGEDKATRPADAERLLEDIGFPFDSGLATIELLDKIELLQDLLFDRSLPFAVPVSFLLDRETRLAATYRGRVDLDALLRDVASLDASPERLHAASAPLPGRWIAQLPGFDPVWLAQTYHRYPEDVERFLELAIEEDPARVQPRRILAGLLRAAGRRDEAIHHYRRAIEIDPGEAEAHQGLGLALQTAGQPAEALRHLGEAARLRPEWPAPLIPMVWLLIRSPDVDPERVAEAVRLAERVLELTGDRHPAALDTLAAAYASAGRTDEAAAVAREAAERAKALGNEALATEIEGRLRRYQRPR